MHHGGLVVFRMARGVRPLSGTGWPAAGGNQDPGPLSAGVANGPRCPSGRAGRRRGPLPRLPMGRSGSAPTAAGVVRCLDGRCRAITTREGLSADIIRSLYVDGDGWLWIGTEGRGLARLDPRRWPAVDERYVPPITRYGTSDGLYDQVVHEILEDEGGRLWMNSNRGIFWVRRDELHRVCRSPRCGGFTRRPTPNAMASGTGKATGDSSRPERKPGTVEALVSHPGWHRRRGPIAGDPG